MKGFIRILLIYIMLVLLRARHGHFRRELGAWSKRATHSSCFLKHFFFARSLSARLPISATSFARYFVGYLISLCTITRFCNPFRPSFCLILTFSLHDCSVPVRTKHIPFLSHDLFSLTAIHLNWTRKTHRFFLPFSLLPGTLLTSRGDYFIARPTQPCTTDKSLRVWRA